MFLLVLKRCREYGLKLSVKKLQIGPKVAFGGFIVSAKGASPDPQKLVALRQFPTPHNLTTLRSFLGCAQQLSHGVPDLSHASAPLRALLKKDVQWQWLPAQEQAFEKVKAIITSDRIVSFYNDQLETELYTDASRLHGLGYVMAQRKHNGDLTIVQCGSRSLTDAESRYSVTELELLGVVYAVKHCKFFLKYAPKALSIITDHRPLIGILAKPLGKIDNGRLLRLREKLIGYTFNASWLPGKANVLADALSRAPVFSPSEQEEEDAKDFHLANALFIESLTDKNLEDFALHCKRDRQTQDAIRALQTGQNLKDLPPSNKAHSLFRFQNQMAYEPPFLLITGRFFIPESFRPKILQFLHIGHMGITKTLALCRHHFMWPGYSKDIKDMIRSCSACAQVLPSQARQNDAVLDTANGPMDILACDLFEFGASDYSVTVDVYSSYFWVHKIANKTTKTATSILYKLCLQYGFPRMCFTDYGPCYRQKFTEFLTENGIQHKVSSAYYAPSNGAAEISVKRAKLLLQKVGLKQLPFHLLAFFNSPLSRKNAQGEYAIAKSPHELFYGRSLRLPNVPTPSLLQNSPGSADPTRKDKLSPLLEGDRVWVQDPKSKKWSGQGTIESVRRNARSYVVNLDDGSSRIVNRMFLRPVQAAKTENNGKP